MTITVKVCAAFMSAVMLLTGTDGCKAEGKGKKKSRRETYPELICYSARAKYRIKVFAWGKNYTPDKPIIAPYTLRKWGGGWEDRGRVVGHTDGRGDWQTGDGSHLGPREGGTTIYLTLDIYEGPKHITAESKECHI